MHPSLPRQYMLFAHHSISLLFVSSWSVTTYRMSITSQSMYRHKFSALQLHTQVSLHCISAEKEQQEIKWSSNFIPLSINNIQHIVGYDQSIPEILCNVSMCISNCSLSTIQLNRRELRSGTDLDMVISVFGMTNKPPPSTWQTQILSKTATLRLSNNECDDFESYMDNNPMPTFFRRDRWNCG